MSTALSTLNSAKSSKVTGANPLQFTEYLHRPMISVEVVSMPLRVLVEEPVRNDGASCLRQHQTPSTDHEAGSNDGHADQPILIMPDLESPGMYRTVIGRARVQAARQTNQVSVPAIICRSMDEVFHHLRGVVAAHEHNQPNPAEVALALQARLDDDPSLARQDLADMIGRDPTWVSHRLRILGLLPDLLARVAASQVPLSVEDLGQIAGCHDRRWQEELIDALLAGVQEHVIANRVRQLKGKPSRARFKDIFRARHQSSLTIRSRFRHLTHQQEREVMLDSLAELDRRIALEEARALA